MKWASLIASLSTSIKAPVSSLCAQIIHLAKGILVRSYEHTSYMAACITLRVVYPFKYSITIFMSRPKCNACRRHDGIMEGWMPGSSSKAFEWMYNEMLVNAWFNFELIKLLSIIMTVCHCILKDDNVQVQQAEKGSTSLSPNSVTLKKNTRAATWNIQHISFSILL